MSVYSIVGEMLWDGLTTGESIQAVWREIGQGRGGCEY